MKTRTQLFIAIATFWIAYPKDASAEGVNHGQLAGMLHAYLNATNEAAYAALKDTFSYTNVTPQAIAVAIEYLDNDGLSPFGGWRTSEPVRLHDMASLIVRCHRADNTIDISNKDACIAFAKAKGCDFGTIQKVVRHIWEQKRGSNKGVVRTLHPWHVSCEARAAPQVPGPHTPDVR